ncbi:MAG: PcfJ domain-containing protein [Ethanoligenens sp.]
MEDVYELMAMIPEPPDDLVDWLKKKGCFQKNLLVMKCGWMGKPGSKVKSLDLVCTACGEHFQVPRDESAPAGCSHGYPINPWASEYHATVGGCVIADGREVACPKCGAAVTGRHIERINKYEEIISACWPLVITRAGKNIIAAGYRVSKKVDKQGNAWIDVEKYEAYVLTEKKFYRFAAWHNGIFYGARTFIGEWEPRVKYQDYFGEAVYLYPMKSHAFRGTRWENCKMSSYRKAAKNQFYPISYLHQFRRRPQMENLLTSGFQNLVVEAVEGRDTANINKIVNWKEKSPRKMLGVSKPDFELLKSKKASVRQIALFNRLRKENQGNRPEILWNKLEGNEYLLCQLAKHEDHILKLKRYFDKQAKLEGEKHGFISVMSDWEDYIKMSAIAGADTEDPLVRFPPHLTAAHDRMVMAQKYKVQKEFIQKFKTMYERLEKYSFEKDGLLIRPAASEDELIKEGKILEHCVGGYGNQHCAGSPIFFIRKKSDPDMPYYTLQLDLKHQSIIQNRGFHNNMTGYPPKPPEIDAFAEYWLEHVVKGVAIETRIRMAG